MVGLDRLSLSFPLVGPPDSTVFSGGSMTVRDGGSSVSYGMGVPVHVRNEGEKNRVGCSVFVGAQLMNGSWWGKIETNPSRLVDPWGASLRDVSEVGASVRELVEYLPAGVRPSCDVESFRVARVDVARDFRGVDDPSVFVRSLLPVKRAHAKRVYVYVDPSLAGAQTLCVGNSQGLVRLYDQFAAYADKGVAAGAVRWECQARAGWVDRVRAGELTPGFLEALAVKRWEWSRMGFDVLNVASDVHRRIEGMMCRHPRPRNRCSESCDGLSPSKARRLFG